MPTEARRGVSEPPESELQMVALSSVDDGNWIRVGPLEEPEHPSALSAEPLPEPHSGILDYDVGENSIFPLLKVWHISDIQMFL